MDAPVIDFQDVSFAYNHAPVVRNVTLRVEPGEFACILGPNGGGKTTLLKLMLGLLRPTSGRISVLGASPQSARPMVGYTPQHMQFDPLLPVSVTDVVLMGALGRAGLLGGYSRAHRRAAREALESVAVADLRRRQFAELSGGQRRRVLIARALVCRPSLLLLDEPTSELDIGAEGDLYELLGRLNRETTIVVASHDVGFVTSRSSKVICVRGTVAVHPTAELSGEAIRDLYGLDVRLVRHDHDCRRDCPIEDES